MSRFLAHFSQEWRYFDREAQTQFCLSEWGTALRRDFGRDHRVLGRVLCSPDRSAGREHCGWCHSALVLIFLPWALLMRQARYSRAGRVRQRSQRASNCGHCAVPKSEKCKLAGSAAPVLSATIPVRRAVLYIPCSRRYLYAHSIHQWRPLRRHDWCRRRQHDRAFVSDCLLHGCPADYLIASTGQLVTAGEMSQRRPGQFNTGPH